MKNFLLTGLLFFLMAAGALAQSGQLKPSSLGISFVFYDFTTPERIRAASIKQVLKEDNWASLNEMSPGLALTYFKGVFPKTDLAATLSGSFADNALPNNTTNSNAFLLQAEAVLQFNMLADKYMFTPYLLGGIGASKYKSYYGAIMPLGGGMKVNFFDEAEIFLNAKYHLPVTAATVKGHFVYGLGIAGIIGKKKEL